MVSVPPPLKGQSVALPDTMEQDECENADITGDDA